MEASSEGDDPGLPSSSFQPLYTTYWGHEQSPEFIREREIQLARERRRARKAQQARKRDQTIETALATRMAMKEALEVMEPLTGRISELLQEAGPRRITSDHDRRGLVYTEKELSTMVAALRQLESTQIRPDHVNSHTINSVAHLRQLAKWIWDLLDNYTSQQRTDKRGAPTTQLPELNLPWIENLQKLNLACIQQLLLVDEMSTTLVTHDGNDPQLRQPCADVSARLVGIDGPRKRLLRWLMDDGERDSKVLKVISIVGPAGVGKTAMAMDVFSHISEQFQCRATAKMPLKPSNFTQLLKHIMSQFVNTSELLVPSEMKPKLVGNEYAQAYDMQSYLQDKRYLVVIDDIRTPSDWEIIKEVFPHNECGSRIVITTGVRSVAQLCSHKDGLVHEVKPLCELDSERLFFAKAFGSDDICPSDHARQVSDVILRRCDGIPLFITAMAGLMQQEQAEVVNRTAAYWLERVPELKQVEEALSPIYDDLSDELKLLSLYMSTFPWGYKIDKHLLISKWRAEELIAPDVWRAFEEVAEEYFSELLTRGIILPVTGRYNYEVESSYQVNHFMLQFLASKAAQKYFLATVNTLNLVGSDRTRVLQRLSLHEPDPELPALLETINFSRIRSLTVSNAVNRISLDNFIHLVMLDLEGWENLEDADLLHICSGNCFLLKYLSIRNTRVSKLPPQIMRLSYLETLDISHTKISELPSEEVQHWSLWTLDLRGTQVRVLPLVWIFCLRCLLINSDRPGEAVTEMPETMSCRLVEKAATLDLSKCSASFIKNLAHLRFLEVLAVTWSFTQCYDQNYQEALRSVIQRSGCLKTLTIRCEFGCSMEFLDSLPDAPQDLQNIIITARFLAVPKWIQGLNHLLFLQITVCKLEPDDLKLLASLRRMKCLVICLEFLPKEAIVIGSIGFRNLLRLSVDCRVGWLIFREGAMPKLGELDLKLTTGPASDERVPSGIGNLLSLEEVTLRYDPWYINNHGVKGTLGALRRQVAELQYTIRLVNNGVEEDVEAILDETAETTETTQRLP